jgi:AcrR family transcriptional regulator
MRVNLARRAEIGAAKRARTRAAILDAARECYAAGPMTVDAVMQAAGLAKGTFYVHFEDLAELESELGATLIAELDERLQPARLAAGDPLTRIATAVTILLRSLAAEPSSARLAAHATPNIPGVSQAVYARLREDLATARKAGRLALSSVNLAARLVTAMGLQATEDLGRGRIDACAIPDIVSAILRALGCAPDDSAARSAEAERNADKFAQQSVEAARNADKFAQQSADADGRDLLGG